MASGPGEAVSEAGALAASFSPHSNIALTIAAMIGVEPIEDLVYCDGIYQL